MDAEIEQICEAQITRRNAAVDAELDRQWVEQRQAQAKTWRDVTAECEVQQGNQIYHKSIQPDGSPYYQHVTDEVGGYPFRLTRISGPLTPHVAFIVEKEE